MQTKTLVIKTLGEEKPLAMVHASLDGIFQVESNDEEAKSYFFDLINHVLRENPTLPLLSGRTEMENGKIIEKTVLIHIPREDVRYLDALCDFLNREKSEYNGKRFRALLTNV